MGKYDSLLKDELACIESLRIEMTDGFYPVIPPPDSGLKYAGAKNKDDNFHYPLGTLYLKYGFRGVADYASSKADGAAGESGELYSGIAAVYYKIADMMLAAGERYEASEDLRVRKIAEMLIHLGKGRPQSFYDALGAEYMVWMIRCRNGADIGRMDYHLKSFFEDDILAGRLTEEEALAYITDVWNGMDRRGSGDTLTNVMIGGMDENGEDTSSRLSVLMLKAALAVNGSEPHINVRVHPKLRQDVWDAMTELQLTGRGQGTMYNDETVIKGLLRRGYDLKYAVRYANDGCTEIVFDGLSDINFNHIDAVAVFELTMNNGSLLPVEKKPVPYVSKNHKPYIYMPEVSVGYESGNADEMKDFGEFYDAFIRQMIYQLDVKMDRLREMKSGIRENATGSFFMNGTFETVLESGRGMFSGGLPCDSDMVFSGSVSTAADCLSGVKRVVFDRKLYSMSEVRQALLNDFKGYEQMQKEMKAAPKFGNDDDEIDLIAADIVRRFCMRTEEYQAKTGFRVLPAIIGWRFLQEAYGVAATPDGRNYGDPIAEHYNAAPGFMKNGPTAVLRSAAKAPLYLGCGAVPIHITLPSGMIHDRDEGLSILSSVCRAAQKMDIMFLNIAIYDVEKLRDAKIHPEKYPDLIVRVWGFSARFVDLAPAMQDHVISRACVGS